MSIFWSTMDEVDEDNKRHLCAFNIFLDRGSSGCEFGQNASAFPSAIIGFRSHLPAWHPWSSLVRARASHWWLLVQILSNLLFQSRQSFSACTAVGILHPVLCALVFTIAWSTRMVPVVAMDVLTGTEWRWFLWKSIEYWTKRFCVLILQHRFGADGVDIAHTRKEENVDEGNNNGLEGTVRALEQIYTNKDYPGNSPSLEVSLRWLSSDQFQLLTKIFRESGKSRADLWAFAALMAVEFGKDTTNIACLEGDSSARWNHSTGIMTRSTFL